MPIRPFEAPDEEPVVALWERCRLVRPWNDPRRDIARKAGVQADLFLVAVEGEAVVGTVMAGYDGHRGWVNYLAVEPDWQRRGIGRGLMHAVETRLRALGCPKVNLQIRRTSADVAAFYRALGFVEDDVLSMGKRLIAD